MNEVISSISSVKFSSPQPHCCRQSWALVCTYESFIADGCVFGNPACVKLDAKLEALLPMCRAPAYCWLAAPSGGWRGISTMNRDAICFRGTC